MAEWAVASSSALRESEQTADPGGRTVHHPSYRRDEAAIELCECMIDVAAALFNVSSKALRNPRKSSAEISRVRQIAMYVTHVTLGLSMNQVGRGFGRDRTTVVYACHIIEDMRDDIEFDRVVSMTEKVAQAAFRGRLEGTR